MSNLSGLTIRSIARGLRRGEFSSHELTTAYLRRIEQANPRLNAYLQVFGDEALDAARAADAQLRAGQDRGPLHGAPLALKDIIDIQGHPTTAGSVILPEEPAKTNAAVVERLVQAGAVILGKLNLHEFAFGGSNDNPHFGRCLNPWKEGYTPGGSSGGAGAAVAAELCAAALGTDTMGSVRSPAAFCSVTGIRPTQGLVGARGVYPLSWTLDTVGPLTADASDAALVLAAIAGPDAADPGSAMREAGDLTPDENNPIRGLRIGVISDFALETGGLPERQTVAEAVSAAIEHLIAMGARRVDLNAPEIFQAADAAMTITSAEAASIHRRHVRDHADRMGADVLERLEAGAKLGGPAVAEAFRLRARLRHRFAKIMNEVDCLILPTTATPAHPFTPGHAGTLTYNAPVSLLGYPAVSTPCGFTGDGRPIGMQIVAPAFAERRALSIVKAYETSTPWHERKPPGFSD